jgi:hypothetical protein
MFAAMRRHSRGLTLLALTIAVTVMGSSTASGATVSAARHGSKGRAHHPKIVPSEVALSQALVTTPGAQVTMQPVGLSMEYPLIAGFLGSGGCPPASLVSALQALGSPPLSLEGDSQDETAPSGALVSPAPNWEALTTYSLPGDFWSQLHCLLSVTRDPLTVGLDARVGQLSWAEQMAAGARSAATNGLAFSIGNEPDLYPLPDYAALDEPETNEESIDVDDYLQIVSYLAPALNGEPLIGPELARPAHWQASLPRVIATAHEQTLGVHLYPLSACETPRAVTIGGLLTSEVAESPSKLAWVVADANAAKVPAVISEANSASCGGVSGVSDSPASAVWALRFVLDALETGFREVRFHFSGDAYDPFAISAGGTLTRPIDGALVALNQWLPVGSTLRGLGGVRELVATAVGQPSGGALLVLDNRLGKARPVVLRGALNVHLQEFTAASAAALGEQLSAVHGRIDLSIPPNSVAAISWTP